MSQILSEAGMQLCAVEPQDAVTIWCMETDSGQWKLNGMQAPYSLHNIEEFCNNYKADPYSEGQIRLMIKVTEDNRQVTVGMADLYDISALNHTAFVGIYVAEEYRRHGHASRALAMTERYARDILNIRTLGARIAEGNYASLSLFSHHGYLEVGRLRQWIMFNGGASDMLIFQKLLTSHD